MISKIGTKAEKTNETRRAGAYPELKEQINLIWKMVDEYIPEAHASEFYQKLKRIKDIYSDNSIRHRRGYRFRSRARLT